MTEGTLQALSWVSGTGEALDLHSIPGFWCDVVEGLDTLPRLRTVSDIVPFRAGRMFTPSIADNRPVVVEGRLIPANTAGYVGLVRSVKRALDPIALVRGTLTATLEDGTVLTIAAITGSVVYGEPLRIMPRVSIEFDADPFWRGIVWGSAWMSDMGLMSDEGLYSDMATGPITLVPAGVTPYSEAFTTLGTTATLDAVVEVDGPSTGAISVVNADGVGFAYPALTGGQTLIVSADPRTATIGGVSVRAALTLAAANRHGEFFRVRPGSDTFTVTGKPAEVRIVHRLTFT